MIGSLFAGCEESPGENEIYQGRRFKVYRGMGSIAAMEKEAVTAISGENTKLVPEGVEGEFRIKGRFLTLYISSSVVFARNGLLRCA